MLDITKTVAGADTSTRDPDGNLYGLDAWSRTLAKQRAADEGLGELSELQWRVIYRLRGLYREHGQAANAREIVRNLDSEFAEMGGRRALYLAFPGGPVSQGSRLAGLPAPPYTSDRSFGSVL